MLEFRYANANDVDLFYKWVNDETARQNSYNSKPIQYTDHVNWYNKRLNSGEAHFYIFIDRGNPVGQVRFEKGEGEFESIISVSVDKDHRGKGYSSKMLKVASEDFVGKHNSHTIIAYIFKTNPASYKSFLKAGYKPHEEELVKGVDSYILSYSAK